MSLQFSTTLRNAMMGVDTGYSTGVWNGIVGESGTLLIYTGSPPAACSDAATGTLLGTFTLSSTPFEDASGGTITLAGLTLSTTTVAAGTAGYFRILDGSSNCHMQGTCGESGADLNWNNSTFTDDQTIEITGFTVTSPGA
jgi:hypothetical protein